MSGTIRHSLISIMLVLASICLSCRRDVGQIKIGASFPLTGEVASAGRRIQNSINLGIDEINTNQKDGPRFVVLFEDDQNKPAMAIGNFHKLVDIDHVAAVIGSAASGCTRAIVPIANQLGVVVVSPISSSASLTTEGGDWFFRVCPADGVQAKVTAGRIISTAVNNIAIIYVNNDWGRSLAEGVRTLVEQKGVKLTAFEGIAEGTRDLRAVLTKVRATGAQLIYAPTYPVDGGALVRQARELEIPGMLLGGDNWDSPEFRTGAGEEANGCFLVKAIEPSGPLYEVFSRSYKTRFGEAPDAFAAWSYDAIKILAKALLKTDGRGGKELAQTLRLTDIEGASGRVAFDENGDLRYPRFAVFEYQQGTLIRAKE